MITQETAGRVWNCYREIAAGEKLLADMAESQKEFREDVRASSLKNAFGERRGLQLGVPSGESSHRLLDVNVELGKLVIEQHINAKRAELVVLNDIVRQECNDGN